MRIIFRSPRRSRAQKLFSTINVERWALMANWSTHSRRRNFKHGNWLHDTSDRAEDTNGERGCAWDRMRPGGHQLCQGCPMYPAGDARKAGKGDVNLFACARKGWISPDREYGCIIAICLHGLPKRPCCDESLRIREICVGTIGGNRLPRPFGPTIGSCAAGEDGLLPMLHSCHSRGYSADLSTGEIPFPEGSWTGVMGTAWAVAPRRSAACRYATIYGSLAKSRGFGGAIVIHVRSGATLSREAVHESIASARPHPQDFPSLASGRKTSRGGCHFIRR